MNQTKILNFSEPLVMSIVNVTPDSFYAASRTFSRQSVEMRVRSVVNEGCDIIDVGGYSSRPGASEVSPEEELRRVAEGVEIIRRVAPNMPISVDTFRSYVVKNIVNDYGEIIVNDISAGDLDESMVEVVALNQLPYIAMHMRGTPQNMQSQTEYAYIDEEVCRYLDEKAQRLKQNGIDRIILDPGFGFAKTTEQNYALLAGFDKIVALGYPTLVGISRKSMIYKVLGTTPEGSLNGTSVLNWELLRKGAKILRVHDTREAVECVKLYKYYLNYGKTDCKGR